MRNRFSIRTAWDRDESALARLIRERRERGGELIDLTVSNPTVCGFQYDSEELLEALRDARALSYDPDPRGMRSARESVAAYYAEAGAEVDPENLVLTTSTSEGYSFLFRLLCDAGDEILVAQPSYPLFDYLADLEDVRLRSYPLFYDYGWWIDIAELERRIGPRTRAILVVHPNNPTGHWTGGQERKRLEEICARHGLALIVDEVFLDYPLSDSPEAVSFACGEHPCLTFVLSGMSKIAALPQMKAGWLLTLGPEAERSEARERLEVIADTFLSMNAPVQLALPRWFGLRHEIQRQILMRAKENLGLLSREGIEPLRTEAGWSAVLRLTCRAEELLEAEGVVLHPGSFYGMGEPNRGVVSLLTPYGQMARGLEHIREFFRNRVRC